MTRYNLENASGDRKILSQMKTDEIYDHIDKGLLDSHETRVALEVLARRINSAPSDSEQVKLSYACAGTDKAIANQKDQAHRFGWRPYTPRVHQITKSITGQDI